MGVLDKEWDDGRAPNTVKPTITSAMQYSDVNVVWRGLFFFIVQWFFSLALNSLYLVPDTHLDTYLRLTFFSLIQGLVSSRAPE